MSELDKVKVSELREGDIVILETETDDWISRAIALLTRSKVTHATISRGHLPIEENDGVGFIAEECPHYAIYDSLLDRTQRVAYVMRLKADVENMKPVMDVVDYYVTNKWPYASAAQPFLAMYFLVKDITNSLKLRKIGEKLMKLTMGVMIELLNQVFRDGKNPMMCSQFVFHCYNEVGKEYKIIRKKDRSSNLLSKVRNEILTNYSYYENILEKEKDYSEYVVGDSNNTDYESVVSSLCEVLEQNNREDKELQKGVNNIQLEEQFVVTAYHFIKLFYQVFVASSEEDRKDLSPKDLLDKFEEMEEYFVAPEDLLHNMENLECIGTVDYEDYHL